MPPFHILRTRKKTPILAEVWVNCMYATVILKNHTLRSTNQSCNFNTTTMDVSPQSFVNCVSVSVMVRITRLQGPGTAARPVNQKVGCHEEKLVTHLNHRKRCNFLLDQRFCKCLDVNGSANENKIFGLVLVLFKKGQK